MPACDKYGVNLAARSGCALIQSPSGRFWSGIMFENGCNAGNCFIKAETGCFTSCCALAAPAAEGGTDGGDGGVPPGACGAVPGGVGEAGGGVGFASVCTSRMPCCSRSLSLVIGVDGGVGAVCSNGDGAGCVGRLDGWPAPGRSGFVISNGVLKPVGCWPTAPGSWVPG